MKVKFRVFKFEVRLWSGVEYLTKNLPGGRSREEIEELMI
jgi:hypothetical protein